MKKIKSVIVTVFVLLVSLSVQAQWAGPDTVVVKKPDNSQTIYIGPHEYSPEYSYLWKGPHIVGDSTSFLVKINPQDPVEIYNVSRFSSCGVEEDQVVVRVVNQPTIVSVTPLRQCYNHGDQISLSDFQIVTDPTGYEWMVTVSPSHASNSFEVIGTGDHQEVTLTLNYGTFTSSKTIVVDVYNDNFDSDNISADIAKIINNLNKIDTLFKSLQSFKTLLKKLEAPDVIKPQFNVNGSIPSLLTVPPGLRPFRTCCNGRSRSGLIVQGGFSIEGGVEVNWPLYGISIPCLGKVGLFAYGDILLGMSAGPFSLKLKGECTEFSYVPITVYFDIEIGVKAILAREDILSASIGVAARSQISKDWNMFEGFRFPPLDVDLALRGKVKALSLFTYNINYKLGSVQLFN